MSLRIVRRLLQQTADVTTNNQPTLGDNENKPEFHRAKKRKQKPNQVPVDEKQVIQHQIDSLLFLDRKMASSDDKKNLTATRLRETHKQQKHMAKCTAKKVLGNSRSSASAYKKAPLPTFNKKIYQKHQKEKKLAQIAKLLQKNSKKANPSTK